MEARSSGAGQSSGVRPGLHPDPAGNPQSLLECDNRRFTPSTVGGRAPTPASPAYGRIRTPARHIRRGSSRTAPAVTPVWTLRCGPQERMTVRRIALTTSRRRSVPRSSWITCTPTRSRAGRNLERRLPGARSGGSVSGTASLEHRVAEGVALRRPARTRRSAPARILARCTARAAQRLVERLPADAERPCRSRDVAAVRLEQLAQP